MKLLNVGCGSTFHPAWINLDFISNTSNVIAYDLRQGLPYPDGTFDACYSSHLIEHLLPDEAQNLIDESFRVLKSQGIIRVVVPDLESTVNEYLDALHRVESGDDLAEPDYDWMMLELYDQSVRCTTGGAMAKFLEAPDLKNKQFVRSRLGREAEDFWHKQVDDSPVWQKFLSKKPAWLLHKVKLRLLEELIGLAAGSSAKQAFREGIFRNSGEIHRWMYDRFSLRRLLIQAGFTEVRIVTATESKIPNFSEYGLDIWDGEMRHANSLFMEGSKP